MTIFFLIFFLSLLHFFNDTGIERFWKKESYPKHLQSKCDWLSACYLFKYTIMQFLSANIISDSALLLHPLQIYISDKNLRYLCIYCKRAEFAFSLPIPFFQFFGIEGGASSG
jgi:hypothetical protein